MKAPLIFGCLLTIATTNLAQQTGVNQSPPGAGDYSIVSRDSDARIWQRVQLFTNDLGVVEAHTNQYTELANGLCVNSNGVWVDAVAQINLVADGAEGDQTRHRVHWMGNANTPGGAVTFTTPDNQIYNSTVFGLAYWDAAANTKILVAQLQNSQGLLVGSNQIVYPSAFQGNGIQADIVYDYTISGMEQNILLRSQLPNPSSLGLNPQTSYLQVWTEFFAPPAPAVTAWQINGITNDAILDFDGMSIGVGQGFLATNDNGNVSAGSVLKQWVTVDNRHFLIEQLPWSQISPLLAQLPAHASIAKPSKRISLLAALNSSLREGGVPRHLESLPLQLAKSTYSRFPALAIDYNSLISSTLTNYDFLGNATYYISGTVNLYGTNTFEGGCVLKYATNASIQGLTSTGQLNFLTSGFNPLICTAKDDNSSGVIISGSTGSPSGYYANPAFKIYGGATTLANVQFAHAETAVFYEPLTPALVVTDSKFVNCSSAIILDISSGVLENDLFANVTYAVAGQWEDGWQYLEAENVTVANSGLDLVSLTAAFTNSIFSDISSLGDAVALTGDHNGFYETTKFGSNPFTNTFYPFQTVGGGAYYLANGCLFTNAGTTDVDAALLADLAQKTVYPPTVTNGWITNNLTLGPQVPRDTNIPSLGFHYDPIDWAVSIALSNATLTVLPGTAIAGCGPEYAIVPYTGSTVSFQGTASAPIYFFRYNTVQEQSNTNWESTNWEGSFLTSWNYSSSSSANFQFTIWDVLAGDTHLSTYSSGAMSTFSFQNCQFYNGQFNDYGPYLQVTNCLFRRVTTSISDVEGGNSTQYFYNNLFTGGAFEENQINNGVWTFKDNLFDTTNVGPPLVGDTCDFNAYISTNTLTSPSATHDIILTGSPAYQVGTLGQYYYPTNLSLIHAGSRLASAAALYHYTVTTNQAIEGTHEVSIGFHYVATDAYGNPLDTDNDGLPDYIKDANGDGLFDAGDLFNWQFPFYIYDQGKTYGGYTPQNLRLGYWKFNNSSLTNQAGQAPSLTNALSLSNSFNGSAVSLYSTNASQLLYHTVTNGQTLFAPANGTIRYWFQPNWSNGSPNEPTYPWGQSFIRASGADGAWSFGFQWAGTNYSNTYLVQLNTASNNFSQEYTFSGGGFGGVPITLRSNAWYQFALTYSPSNIALYTNGVLFSSGVLSPLTDTTNSDFSFGDGLTVYPPTDGALDTLAIGSYYGQPCSPSGQIDELETFNYPLSYKAIAYGFPGFGGPPGTVGQDSDYDGRSDMLETNVDGTVPTNPNSVVQCRLGYWRFDTPDLIGEQGQVPLSSSNVTLVPSWSGTALNISSAASSHVTYPDVSSNGWANINCRHGAVRFWYKPNAIGVSGTFLYMGTASGSDAWTLNLNSGDTISFDTQTNEMGYTPVIDAHVAPLSPSKWTQIVLTYSATNCTLFINGTNAGSSSGNANWPSPSNRALGIVVGNAAGLSSPINGQIDELETFNYQLALADISNNFQLVANIDSDLNGIPDLLEDIQLSTSRPFLGQPFVVTGTLEAEQFDMGSNGVAYYTVVSHPTNSYRPTGMFITNCNDILGATNITTFGYCLDQTCAGEWVKYTINVLVPQIYTIEARVAGIGTNGYFSCGFSNAALGTYTNTGPLLIPTNNWTLVSTNVWLAAGTNVMTLSFLTNGLTNNVRGTNVGRFNYLSIYPWWQAGFTSAYTKPVTGLSNNINTWEAATNNTIQIQNAINNVIQSGGGTVLIPSGTFYVSQLLPDEIKNVDKNTVASVYSNDVAIAGAGKTSTMLIGFNRATTIAYIGLNTNQNNIQCTNFTIRDLTLEAQPHLAVFNVTNTIFELGGLLQSTGTATGTLIYNSPGTNQYNYNILITNCQFLFADCAFGGGSMSNVLLTSCNFIVEGGTNVYTDQTNTSPTPHTQLENDNVQVFAWALNFNAIGNTFNGNTNLVPTNSNPFGYVNTNAHQIKTPTGFIWLQSEGNVFVARNAISNYWGEAIQLNVGPNSVVGNSFYSLQNDISACALCSGASAWSGFTPIDYTTSFVGNWIYGGTLGAKGTAQSNAFNVDVSGNYLTLYPPFNEWGEQPGSIASVAGCGSLVVIGNTLNYGGLGIDYQTQMTNLILMDNNLSGAAYRGMGRVSNPNSSIQSAAIFRNILSDGVSCHVQLPTMNTFGWFLRQNTYLDPSSNSVPAFLDPQSSSVHSSQ